MNRPIQTKWIAFSEYVYGFMLLLYPVKFRQEYGRPMAQVFRDMCRDSYRHGGIWSLVMWWIAALFDLLQSVITEHRKVDLTMSKTRFIQWSGWLCIFGGIFFAAASVSQLQPGSHYSFYGVYQLSIYALVPGMILITLGLLGIWLRYSQHIVLFGKLALLTSLLGAGVSALGWLFTLTGGNFYAVFMVGFLVHLIGQSVFAGFATTTRLLPRWNYTMLIGSALPLTVVMLTFANQGESYGVNWGSLLLLLLIGISWIWTGLALNTQPATSLKASTAY